MVHGDGGSEVPWLFGQIPSFNIGQGSGGGEVVSLSLAFVADSDNLVGNDGEMVSEYFFVGKMRFANEAPISEETNPVLQNVNCSASATPCLL